MKKHRLAARWHQLSEDEIRRLQTAKLKHYLQSVVVPFSAHYREVFHKARMQADSIQSIEDLARIPFASKSDLLNSPQHPQRARDFLIVPDKKALSRRVSTVVRVLTRGKRAVASAFESEFRPIFLTSTTGRSADPIPFLYTNHDLNNLAWGGYRIMEVCGAERDFKLVNMFPYAPHLAFWLTHYAATSFGIFSVGTGGGKVLGTDGNLRLIKKIDPDVLIGMPTFMYHVMQQAVEEGMRCPNLKRLVLGGEKVADGTRDKLRHLAEKLGSPKVDVLATYGFTEAKMAWAECPHPAGGESGGYHLYPDLGLFEVIDPKTGEVLPPETPGELVFTPLDARGTVVLRYRTGDLISEGMTYRPCPYCGRTMPRLLGKISRNSEIKSMQLDKIKGTLVDFNQLEHVMDDAPDVVSWQLELRKVNDDPMDLDELILHVHAKDSSSKKSMIHDLRNRFVERTEISPNRVEFHSAEALRKRLGVGVQLKEQKIIDNRPGTSQAKTVAGSPPAVVGSNQPSQMEVHS